MNTHHDPGAFFAFRVVASDSVPLGMWFLASYQSGSAIGESEKAAGGPELGFVQAGQTFRRPASRVCVHILLGKRGWR